MKKNIITHLCFALIVSAVSSCQQDHNKSTSVTPKDTTAIQAAKPTESGYAAVNGLKLYYEVYGQGKQSYCCMARL